MATQPVDEFDEITDHMPPPPARTTRANRHVKPKVEIDAEFIDPETGKPFVRRSSTANDNVGVFEIPESQRRKGWVYQWQPIKVLNEPVDPASHVNMKMQGWRPVHPKEMPDQVPPGWTGDTIERGSQILYKRPLYLEKEAVAELKQRADQQMEDKFASAQMAPAGTAPRHLAQVRNRVEALPDDLRAQLEEEV